VDVFSPFDEQERERLSRLVSDRMQAEVEKQAGDLCVESVELVPGGLN
jgi:hypothetical protein